jgi:apolipoprotein N-acyltransferase
MFRNQWLLLAVCFMLALAAFSIKLNIPYQLHALFSRKLAKKEAESSQRESGELNFVSGMTGALLFIGFLLIYFGKFADAAWIFILIMSLLLFLACFVGFCVATLTYVFFKKLVKR